MGMVLMLLLAGEMVCRGYTEVFRGMLRREVFSTDGIPLSSL